MLGHVNEPNKKFAKKVGNFSDRKRGKNGNFPELFRKFIIFLEMYC